MSNVKSLTGPIFAENRNRKNIFLKRERMQRHLDAQRSLDYSFRLDADSKKVTEAKVITEHET